MATRFSEIQRSWKNTCELHYFKFDEGEREWFEGVSLHMVFKGIMKFSVFAYNSKTMRRIKML